MYVGYGPQQVTTVLPVTSSQGRPPLPTRRRSSSSSRGYTRATPAATNDHLPSLRVVKHRGGGKMETETNLYTNNEKAVCNGGYHCNLVHHLRESVIHVVVPSLYDSFFPLPQDVRRAIRDSSSGRIIQNDNQSKRKTNALLCLTWD